MPFAVQRSRCSTKINALAGSALAVCLAIVMLAPIIFSAFQYYSLVPHPSWVFWGLLTISGLIVSALRYYTIQPNSIDLLMTILLSLIFISISLNRNEISGTATVLIMFFVVLPYVAGRLLTSRELMLFFRVGGLVAFAGVVIAIGGLLDLDHSEFMTDRIKTLFVVTDLDGVVVLGGGVIPHLSLAAGWLALMSIYCLIDTPATKSKLVNICLCLVLFSVSIYLLFLIGLRGSVIAAIVTCIFMVTIGRSPLRQKALVTLYILAVCALSYSNLSVERAHHYGIIGKTFSSFISYHKNIDDWVNPLADRAELSDSCGVKGNGIATRLLLFEKTKALIHEFPLFGVGVGRWGIVTECSGYLGTPHNFLLHVAAELGLIGVLVAALLIVAVLIKILTLRRNTTHQYLRLGGLSASFLTFLLIQSQFSGGFILDYQLYAIFGAISGLVNLSSRDGDAIGQYS